MAKRTKKQLTDKASQPAPTSIDEKISVDEGFQRLLRHFREAHETREHYNAGLRANRVRLWVDAAKDQPVDPDKDQPVDPNWHIVDPNWIEHHVYVEAQQANDGRWNAEIAQKGGIGFKPQRSWAVSTSDIQTLIDKDIAANQRHAGGRPPEYNEDEIRAVAFIALARLFFKKGVGAIPEDYSGNDLAAEVRAILGDEHAPKPTRLGEIINPLLQRLKARLNVIAN
jgi:hypothetical protein